MSLVDITTNIFNRLSDGQLDLADAKSIVSQEDPWFGATESIGGDLSALEYATLVAFNAEVQAGRDAAMQQLRYEQQLIAMQLGLTPPANPSLTRSFAMTTQMMPGRLIMVTPEAADTLARFVLSNRPDGPSEEAAVGAATGLALSGAVTAATSAGGVWGSTVTGARLGRLAGLPGAAIGAGLGLAVGLAIWAFDD